MDSLIWVILAVVVVLVLIGILVSRSRKQRKATHRADAQELRTRAAEHDRDVRERGADAAEADAQARRARAEADERAARAERLEVEAERRGERLSDVEATRDEQLRRADELDPDVRTDKAGNRIAGNGARIEDDDELADPYGGRGETRYSPDDDDRRGDRLEDEGHRVDQPQDGGANPSTATSAAERDHLRRTDPPGGDADRR